MHTSSLAIPSSLQASPPTPSSQSSSFRAKIGGGGVARPVQRRRRLDRTQHRRRPVRQDRDPLRLRRRHLRRPPPPPLCAHELTIREYIATEPTLRDVMPFWLYSSGSTGKPKAFVHLQHDIPYTCVTYAEQVLCITEKDTTFSTTGLFHAYGFGNNLT